MRAFDHFVAIDWSGANVARPPGLAVASAAAGAAAPVPLTPAGGWSRGDVLDWLVRHAAAGTDMLVGLDLSPALPFADVGDYFPGWRDSPADARALWSLVDGMAGDAPHLSVGAFLDDPEVARHFRQHRRPGAAYAPGRGRLRVCEEEQLRQGLSPTSCFNLVGASQVGKSSLTGMRVLHRLAGRVPVWPFDPPAASGPMIVEIYTTIAARAAGMRRGLSKMRDRTALDAALEAIGSRPHRPLPRYDDHVTDAILSAAWLRTAARRPELWSPARLNADLAATEGWTFGVT